MLRFTFACSNLSTLIVCLGISRYTGGAIGVSPLQAGLYGLLASFLTMALGHWIGLRFAGISKNNKISNLAGQKSRASSYFPECHLLLDPSFASGSLLGVLCLVSLQELLVTWQSDEWSFKECGDESWLKAYDGAKLWQCSLENVVTKHGSTIRTHQNGLFGQI